jgi:hypothetical protein
LTKVCVELTGEKKRGFQIKFAMSLFGISVKCQKKNEEGNFVRKYTLYIIFSILKKPTLFKKQNWYRPPLSVWI